MHFEKKESLISITANNKAKVLKPLNIGLWDELWWVKLFYRAFTQNDLFGG